VSGLGDLGQLWTRRVADGFVELPQLQGFVGPFRDLADDAGRLAGNDAEAGDDHVGREDGAFQNAHVVLDDGELANHRVLADVDVAPNGSGLDDGARADEDVVAHAERHVGKGSGGPQPVSRESEPRGKGKSTLCRCVPADGGSNRG